MGLISEYLHDDSVEILVEGHIAMKDALWISAPIVACRVPPHFIGRQTIPALPAFRALLKSYFAPDSHIY